MSSTTTNWYPHTTRTPLHWPHATAITTPKRNHQNHHTDTKHRYQTNDTASPRAPPLTATSTMTRRQRHHYTENTPPTPPHQHAITKTTALTRNHQHHHTDTQLPRPPHRHLRLRRLSLPVINVIFLPRALGSGSNCAFLSTRGWSGHHTISQSVNQALK